MKAVLFGLLAVCLLGGATWNSTRAQDGHVHGESYERSQRGEIVPLSPSEVEEFGITVVTAGPGKIESSISVPAEIRANADRLAHIVPRYAGIVTAVKANIGDRVEEGQVLARVEGDESLAPFDVVTLISGTVIAKHITLGEAVGRGNPAFEIADLSSVWVDITVYQRDLERVRVDQKVELYVGHELFATGTLSYVTPVVDESTRTATARAVLPNRDGRWLPGMFATAKIITSEETVPVAIDRAALHTFEDYPVVFVQTSEGFVPRRVTTGRMDAGGVEILEGLSAGERYVESGGFTIKAELGKKSFGASHAH
jgi:cobalt-zinc-cadmium efflux system membrane fusion protein